MGKIFTEKVEIIKCSKCKRMLDVEKQDDFLVVHGNITRGMSGGLIGNNFDNDMVLKRVTVFCFDWVDVGFFNYLKDSCGMGDKRTA